MIFAPASGKYVLGSSSKCPSPLSSWREVPTNLRGCLRYVLDSADDIADELWYDDVGFIESVNFLVDET